MIDRELTTEEYYTIRKFENRFQCRIRNDVPDGRLVMDTPSTTLDISSISNDYELMKLVSDSMKHGKNILSERYKHLKIVYDDSVDY